MFLESLFFVFSYFNSCFGLYVWSEHYDPQIPKYGSSSYPAARKYGSTWDSAGGLGYLFGGFGVKNKESCPEDKCYLGDFWSFNTQEKFSLANAGNIWTRLSPDECSCDSSGSSSYPSSRKLALAWYDGGEDSLLLCGGVQYADTSRGNLTTFSDLWIYKISSNTWTQKAGHEPVFDGITYSTSSKHYYIGGCSVGANGAEDSANCRDLSNVVSLTHSATASTFEDVGVVMNFANTARRGWVSWGEATKVFAFGGSIIGGGSSADRLRLFYLDFSMDLTWGAVDMSVENKEDVPAVTYTYSPEYALVFYISPLVHLFGGVYDGTIFNTHLTMDWLSDPKSAAADDLTWQISTHCSECSETPPAIAGAHYFTGIDGNEVFVFGGDLKESATITEVTNAMFEFGWEEDHSGNEEKEKGWLIAIYVVTGVLGGVICLLCVVSIVVFLLFEKDKICACLGASGNVAEKYTEMESQNKVLTILRELQMADYLEHFQRSNIEFNTLADMDEHDLVNVIADRIPRKRFVKYLQEHPEMFDFESESETDSISAQLEKRGWLLEKEKLVRLEVINQGSFGVVRKGTLQVGLLSIPVAIKTIPLDQSVTQQEVTHEVRIMTELRHENVLACYGICIDDTVKQASVVTQFCEMGDLFDYKEKIKSFSEKVRVLLETAKGMSYLHTKDIIHRDLKTQNLLITKGGRIKLCDFGSSRHAQSVNQTFCGTLEYLAPEQYDIDLCDDPKLIDVYSFGIIIWEVWAQVTPFDDEELDEQSNNNQMEKLKIIQCSNLRPNLSMVADMPERLKTLMKSCWKRDPKERPDNFDIIVDQVQQIYDSCKK